MRHLKTFQFVPPLLALLLASSACAVAAAEPLPPIGKTASLFDGKTLSGWEGDTKLWRVQDVAITGGSLTETVKQNEFLASTRDYTNFIVRFKIKLTGSEGFINSGFQIRSQRVPKSSEMAGYQCDYGEPNWYGAVYDESRRNKVMSASDMKALRPVLRSNDWNEYVIRADGPRITTWINGVMGTDFIEPDTSLPNYDWGKFGIQVHGGGKTMVQVRDVTVEELPATPPQKKFLGAPEPKKSAKASPLLPEEERASFTLPPGFEIELIAAESEGIGKFVAVDWDQRGNLWTMTALEYPVDANENPAAAKELYASKAKDKVLVFDRDSRSPTGYSSKARVFAQGLAIPLGILPYRNGVYVQHGPEIVFLSDSDGDGRADKREVILSGFGVQDSHLFPHQFTRASGNWIWMAQGAFNYGKVRTTTGKEQQFDQTRMAKFRYDGSDFDITSQGPCNIWGLAITAEGNTWIQEANDYGYPTMPFHEYANYPGCSDAQWKSYAPEFPGTAPDFRMGGTGLSGLAITDAFRSHRREKAESARDVGLLTSAATGSWPEAYCGVHYIANPITRKIQAVKAHRDGPRWLLQKLPDFVQSSDEWFRPVALRLGPDGCLYFVDWYNKIISHNEVPRNHPERDKKRGRIWRVKCSDVKPLEVPDFTTISGDELLAKLGGENTTQSHFAWQAIGDRQMRELGPKLRAIIADHSQSTGRRIASLWSLEELNSVDVTILKPLLSDSDRDVRREALRAYGELSAPMGMAVADFESLADDPDPEVRAQVARTTALVLEKHLASLSEQMISDVRLASESSREIALLTKLARAPLHGPTMKSTHNGRTIKTGEAYEREFERYLVRRFLEQHPRATALFLASDAARALPVENRLVAALALEPNLSATSVARLLPELSRPPNDEELLRLAKSPEEPGVAEAMLAILRKPETCAGALESLLKLRTKLDATKLAPLLTDASRQLLGQTNTATRELGSRLAGSFQLVALEPDLARVAKAGQPSRLSGAGETAALLSALRALREIKSAEVDLLAVLLKDSADVSIQTEAAAALAASRDPAGPAQLASLYPLLPAAPRRSARAGLSSTRAGAVAFVKAIRDGRIAKEDLDGATLDRLEAVLAEDKDLSGLLQEIASRFRLLLRLNGEDNAWVESDITLEGPFTLETWVKLDPGIDNNDGILGAPGALDMNFYDAHFRIWVGGEVHDAIVAKKKMLPEVWTHLAVTRDEKGNFCIYQNGELDTADSKPAPQKFQHCRIGWTAPVKGTAGWLTEFRVRNRVRTADEIRADFDRTFEDETGNALPSVGADASESSNCAGPTNARPAGLEFYASGSGPWGKLHGGAKVMKTADFPALLTAGEARAQAQKFARFRSLAGKAGDAVHGQTLFTTTCMGCHSVGGNGGQIGPVLNSAGALGVEALLRNVLTPNAAMEPGYRVFRVELKDGDVIDGLLVSQDSEAVILRRQNAEDLRIPQNTIRRADFIKMSMMPEGLLEAFPPQDVTDLFAYLKMLK
jgi:putative membrane-bound dehydrogenase-like protein